MRSEVSLRQLTPLDGDAYASLMAASPDTGRIGVSQLFQIDAYQALATMHGDFIGVVAEHSQYQGFVGGGLIRFGECQFEGGLRPYALLNTLVVHPSFRRRGIASELAQWRFDCARKRVGLNGAIWAIIQRGNIGSELTARKWRGQFLKDRLTLIPLKPRTSPPKLTRDYEVRRVPQDKFRLVSEQVNRFYQSYNMYTPRSEAALATWLSMTPFEKPFRHMLVVNDSRGEAIAGLVVTEMYKLRTLKVVTSPLIARFANRLLHVVPPDYIMREVCLSHIWFAPGLQKAAKFLLESVRWEWRDRASSLMVWVDSHSPHIDILDLHPWTLRTASSMVIQGDIAMSEISPVYYE
jgi:GNAT superfamily N-acetyltransferase